MELPKYGTVLPNGAKVIYFKPQPHREGRLPTGWVFADSDGQLADWECSLNGDKWVCYWGYYSKYEDFPQAWADFCKRAGIEIRSE